MPSVFISGVSGYIGTTLARRLLAGFQAAVVENRPASTGLIHLVVECDHPLEFLPGQFAMLNFTGANRRTFGRPFSILAAAGRRSALTVPLFSRERLIELARGPGSDTDSRSMEVQVSRVRKLVEPDPALPRP